MAGDHEEVAETGQVGDITGDPVAQMVVARIVGQVVERQDRDRGFRERLDDLARRAAAGPRPALRRR